MKVNVGILSQKSIFRTKGGKCFIGVLKYFEKGRGIF